MRSTWFGPITWDVRFLGSGSVLGTAGPWNPLTFRDLKGARADWTLQDQDNPAPVLSTVEDWRIGSGADHRHRPFRGSVLVRDRESAPNCMGAWLV
jgi:hypothetical protein